MATSVMYSHTRDIKVTLNDSLHRIKTSQTKAAKLSTLNKVWGNNDASASFMAALIY